MPATSVATPTSIPAPADLKAAMASDSKIDVSSLFSADKATRDAAATSFAAVAQKEGPSVFVSFNDAALKALADKKSPAAREGAAAAVSAVIAGGAIQYLEPTFVSSGLFAALIEAFADKMPAPRAAAV